VTDDDGLHSVEPVGADNIGTPDHRQPTAVGTRRVEQAPPKASRDSRLGRAEDDENALAAPQSIDRGRSSGAAIARDDEIDGLSH
jgi:hypothetical protein